MTSLFKLASRFLLLFALALSLRAQTVPTFANVTVHDPAIVRDGATYHVFGSHMASASSKDLLAWKQIASGPATPNALIRNQNPRAEFAEALAWAQTDTFWAPDVIKLGDGKYYYYYCACQGSSPLSALGLAVADSIEGPYANVAILLKSGMTGMSPAGVNYNVNIHPNVVDPSLFYDKTGKLWMVYGSFSGGIFILAIDSAPGSATIGQPLPGQGYGKKLIGGNSSRIEGATICYSPETDYYYLFMTFGGLDANGGYNIRLGRSRTPDGPFLDASGNDLTQVKGTFAFDDATIAPYGTKLMGNWQFQHVAGEPGSTSRGYLSPGGCSVYRDPELGRYLLAFHTRFVGRGEVHEVRLHQLFLNLDDWFVAAPQRFAREAVASVSSASIAGDYRLIEHGKAITSAVSVSSVVTLASNGSVSGTQSGTWSFSGDRHIVLTLSGKSYKGVLARVWDDDNQVWVLSFSALASDGVALWACKVAATTSETPPTIASQPSAQSVKAGSSATLSVSASGSVPLVYQWKLDGVDIPGATSSSYTIPEVSAADAGSYSVVVGNSVASFQSDPAFLEVTAAPAPVVTTQPSNRLVSLGAPVVFQVKATGTPPLSYQWSFNGVPISGATSASYALDAAKVTDSGAYSVVVTNAAGSTTSETGMLMLSYATPGSDSSLGALACRAVVGSGDDVIIPGIAVAGSGTKQVVVRAHGPALTAVGIDGALQKPQMTLYRSGHSAPLATNAGWSSGTATETAALQNAFAQIKLSPFPLGSADSALLANLEAGAAYSIVISGADGKGGLSLVEVYELGASSAHLSAIACRARVGVGDQVLIPGFIIAGTTPKQVLIRASGPVLKNSGIQDYLAKPQLSLHNLSKRIAENTGWNTALNASAVAAATTACGLTAFPADSADSAILVTLAPGAYTALLSGAGDTSGVAVIEVYEVP